MYRLVMTLYQKDLLCYIMTYCDDFVGAYCEPETPRLVHVHPCNGLLEESKISSRSSAVVCVRVRFGWIQKLVN